MLLLVPKGQWKPEIGSRRGVDRLRTDNGAKELITSNVELSVFFASCVRPSITADQWKRQFPNGMTGQKELSFVLTYSNGDLAQTIRGFVGTWS